MDLILIIIILCCCSYYCIILLGGSYFYITNTSSEITSKQSPNISELSSTSKQSSTSEQSSTTIKPITTTTPIPVIKWIICGTDVEGLPTIAYSYDGTEWTQTKNIISKNGTFQSIAYNGQMWVAVGQSTNFIIAISTDGINWTLNNFSNSYYGIGTSIYWSGSLWVTVGYANLTGNGVVAAIVTSTDGLNWSIIDHKKYTNSNSSFNTVVYNPSVNTWVAAGSEGGNSLVVYSKDGINWIKTNNPIIRDNGIMKITIINSQFVATVMSYINLIYSTDGITWNQFTNIIPNNIMSNPFKIILFNNIMIIGGLGLFQIGYSTDEGKTWKGSIESYITLNITNNIVANKSNTILAVGYDRKTVTNKSIGQILSSTDGINWSASTISFMTIINDVVSSDL
jgi:hypothetical protein